MSSIQFIVQRKSSTHTRARNRNMKQFQFVPCLPKWECSYSCDSSEKFLHLTHPHMSDAKISLQHNENYSKIQCRHSYRQFTSGLNAYEWLNISSLSVAYTRTTSFALQPVPMCVRAQPDTYLLPAPSTYPSSVFGQNVVYSHSVTVGPHKQK